MKNKVKVILIVLFLALPNVLRAQYTFTTNADNTITASSYFGPNGAVTIPSSFNSLPVTVVGVGTFTGKSGVTSITVPNSITNIGRLAFASCSGLTNVTLGTNIAIIGTNAFVSCTRLTNIALPDSVTNLGDAVFEFCTNLTNIIVGALNPVFSSSNGILFSKDRSTLVAFPGGLGGSYAIPANTTGIAYGAFLGNAPLTDITIHQGVTNIGASAFAVCQGLTSITVDASNPAYCSSSGVLFDKAQTTLLQCPGGMNGTYSVASNITALGMGAFSGCSSLAAINLPNTITDIPNLTFYYCTNLANFIVPATVTNIESYAFEVCSHLTSVRIGESVVSIGDSAFVACTSLKQVVIPSRVTSIGASAFSGCTVLTNVTILGNITNMGSAAFIVDSSLKSVYFQGNAPPAAVNAFTGDPVTVYYLPGTTGWSSTYNGAPAVLWNPQAQSLRTNVGQFQFDITGPSNSAVVIVASSDLSNPVWVPVATNALSAAGTSTFTDPQSGGFSQRFYRFRSP